MKVPALVRSKTAWLKPLWTACNERLLGIRTEPDHRPSDRSTARAWWRGEQAANAKFDDNNAYASIDYWNVRKFLRVLAPGPADVFIDIGSGMGRIVCVAARLPLRKCIGIELSSRLCEQARANAIALRGRRAPIDIICADAASADLSEGTMYFLFNPFGAETLSQVLANISRSLEVRPRAIRILYYNSVHDSVFQEAGWLTKVLDYKSLGGLRINLWRNLSPSERPLASVVNDSAQPA